MLKLRNMTGRDLAIIGAAWLDAAVELNLRYNMQALAARPPTKEVFARGLRGLESRLWVADAFGLFGGSDVRPQADLLRRVRNEFAHTIEDVDCDSPTIAPLIDQMNLTPEGVTDDLVIRAQAEERASERWSFQFDGEEFNGADVAAIYDESPDRLLFFVPLVHDIRSRDDRLRAQIYAAVHGALGLGLKSWLLSEGATGLVDVTEDE